MSLFPDSARPSVFIASSTRDAAFAETLRSFLSSTMDAQVWNDRTFFTGQMTLDVLHAMVRKHEFSVCILGHQDNAQAFSPNVMIELGMFLSVNGARRTFIVCPGGTSLIPSDMAGVTYIKIPPSLANSVSESATFAYNHIESSVRNLWHSPAGIRAKGSAWHSGTYSRDSLAALDDNGSSRITYTISDAVLIIAGGFLTFRAAFDMHNFQQNISGQFFGRGPIVDGVAHTVYTATDKTNGYQFTGNMIIVVPGIADIWGTFISRDELHPGTDGITVGGFRVKRLPEK